MKIVGDYKLTITVRGGELLSEIDLEGYDLDKQIARGDLVNDIEEVVWSDIYRLKQGGKNV